MPYDIKVVRKVLAETKCKHGLHPVTCAVCQGPVRVPAALRTKEVDTRPPKTILPEMKDRSTISPHALWSLQTTFGVITICGICHGIAADYSKAKREHIAKLIAKIRTNKCKWCDGVYDADECESSDSPDGLHRRKWLIRSITVPACLECSGHAEYEVDSDKVGRDAHKIPLNTWAIALRMRGLLDE